MTESIQWNWPSIADSEVKEILRQSEAMLADMLTTSCAADARGAAIVCGYGTVAAGMVGGAMVAATLSGNHHGLVAAVAFMALGFLAAAIVSARGIRPRDFYVSGNEPARLVAAAVDERHLLTSCAESYQRRIDHNRCVLNSQARWTAVGHGVALAAVIFGAVVFLGVR